MQKDYVNTTYYGGSVSESDSLVDGSFRLMPKDYVNATYSARSLRKIASLVDESYTDAKGLLPRFLFC